MLSEILEKHQDKFFAEKLSFSQYLDLVNENPHIHLRNAAMYLKDTFDYFGQSKDRFALFYTDKLPSKKIYGNSKVQNLIYNSFCNFIEEGYNNKLLLLVGPNGSAKSSIVGKIVEACEYYSKEDEGALYTFSWVFPLSGATKLTGQKRMGIATDQDENKKLETASYAHLKDDEIGSVVLSELRDHPILLIPKSARQEYIKKILTGSKEKEELLAKVKKTYLYNGDVSKQNKEIFNALLKQYDGDFDQVFRHVRVERFDISKRYSKAAATVEPQMHVDAKQQQITMDQKIQNLPPCVQALNLHKSTGELIYANRGILEFSDFLKRNHEAFKYLLMTIESKTINIQGILTELDILFFGTSNEIHYDQFQNSPDFKSFRARFKTIHVPYLLSFKDEKHIYQDHVKNVDLAKFEKHSLEAFSMWSVMTRLHEPKAEAHKGTPLENIVPKMDCLDKAIVYSGLVKELDSEKFKREEIKELKKAEKELKREFINKKLPTNMGIVNYYEGRFGISPREGKEILLDLCHNHQRISFFDVLNFVKEFEQRQIYGDENTTTLVAAIEQNQDPMSSFKNNEVRIKLIENYYKNKFDEEIRDAMDLVDNNTYEKHIKKYIYQISALNKKETIFNEATGKYEDPDIVFIEKFEESIGERHPQKFRDDMLGKLGAYALETRGQTIVYTDLFDEDIYSKLKKNFVESQKRELKELSKELDYYQEGQKSENQKVIDKILNNLKSRHGYSKETSLKLISFVYRSK